MSTTYLDFDRGLNAFVIRLEHGRTEVGSYTLGIKNDGYYADESKLPYRFVRITNEDGDWFELVTKDELKSKVDDVAEHEGDAIAKLWEENQQRYRVMNATEEDLFKGAVRRFLAFVELGLHLPVIFGKQFENDIPVIDSLVRLQMDEISRAEMAASLRDFE